MFWKTFWNFLVRRKISPAFGRKKTGNLFLISCFCVAVNSGGYSVVIPQKQTCSPCLKRFLCRWGFGCPALSFSASCKSHLSRLTGSYRFPCSIRLQKSVPLWILAPDWRQGSSAPYSKRVRLMSAPPFSTRRWCGLISNPGKISIGECGGCMASSGIISARAAMASSTAFSSASLNVSMIILATISTSCYWKHTWYVLCIRMNIS